MEKTAFDPKRRRLCPDGACIGVIGTDGKCRECGRVDAGAVAAGGGAANAAGAMSAMTAGAGAAAGDVDLPEAGGQQDVAGSEEADEADEAVLASGDDAFNPNRKLCSDGSCLGVVGPTGECPVCGTRAEA